ncbi:MAG: VOC family protein [Pseudomonadota bacterium]|nr:VOC family protein [Pseudomonadota bacterium]
MIDHITLHVRDFPAALAFYTAAFAPLGYTVQKQYGESAAGFGRDRKPSFWIVAPRGTYWTEGHQAGAAPAHFAFVAADRAAVDAFHAAALAAGAKDFGAPGMRPQYHAGYYGAFVLDPDGNNVEAVCHRA